MEGGCTCGQVRYRLTGTPLIVHACHCHCCQRETGTAHALNALYEADRVVHTAGEPELVATPSASGKGQKIARCPTCRVAVWQQLPTGRARGPLRPRRHDGRPEPLSAGHPHLHVVEAVVGDAAARRPDGPRILRISTPSGRLRARSGAGKCGRKPSRQSPARSFVRPMNEPSRLRFPRLRGYVRARILFDGG